MKTFLFAVVLTLASVSFALADENYYACFNLDASSKKPANVMVMATPQGMTGLMNAANVNPPRALFTASPATNTQFGDAQASNGTELKFGPVNWQGKHDAFDDFLSATADFDASDRMVQVSFTYKDGTAVYGNCVLQSDN